MNTAVIMLRDKKRTRDASSSSKGAPALDQPLKHKQSIKKAKTARKRNTVIWEYYSYDLDDFNSSKDKFPRAVCLQPGCTVKVPRPAASTTGMKNHLELHHPAAYIGYLAKMTDRNLKKVERPQVAFSSSEEERHEVPVIPTTRFAPPSVKQVKRAPTAKKRNTVIWEYYAYDELNGSTSNDKFQRVVCLQPGCGVKVPRPAATTTGMKNHLELHHPAKYSEYLIKMTDRNLKRVRDELSWTFLNHIWTYLSLFQPRQHR